MLATKKTLAALLKIYAKETTLTKKEQKQRDKKIYKAVTGSAAVDFF